MKKIAVVLSLSAAALIISACTTTSQSEPATDPHMGHNMQTMGSSSIIDLMHEPMMQVPFQKTNNVDADFIANMIPHHRGAILAAQKLLETTTNPELTALAESIVSSQEAEVTEFTALIPDLEAKAIDYTDIAAEFSSQAEHIMNTMMTEMSAIEPSMNNDIDFLRGMIPHHQAAVDASRQILAVTKDPVIKEIAERIIAAQEKEITDMNAMLSSIMQTQ